MRPDFYTDDFMDRLDAYLMGTLPPAALADFQSLMAQDKELEAYISFNQSLHFSMQNADLKKVSTLISEVKEIENERVEKWIDGTLSPEESKALELDFEVHKDLAQWAKDKRDLAFVIQNHDLPKVQKLILESKSSPAKPILSVTTNNTNTNNVRSISWARSMGAVAACVAVLVGVYVSFFMDTQKQDVFATYYKPHPSADIKAKLSEFVSNIATTDEDLAKLQSAMDNYKIERYHEAIMLFDELLAKNPLMSIATFYKGCALMSLKEFEKAIPLFESIASSPIPVHQSEYKIESFWYLSLAYIEMERTDKAKIYLEKLSKNPNPYRVQAGKILEDMEKM